MLAIAIGVAVVVSACRSDQGVSSSGDEPGLVVLTSVLEDLYEYRSNTKDRDIADAVSGFHPDTRATFAASYLEIYGDLIDVSAGPSEVVSFDVFDTTSIGLQAEACVIFRTELVTQDGTPTGTPGTTFRRRVVYEFQAANDALFVSGQETIGDC